MMDLDEAMVASYGWGAVEHSPSTALAFEHPFESRVLLVRRQYSKVREWPFLKRFLEPSDAPWGFYIVDVGEEEVVEQEGFETAFDARERLQSYLESHPVERPSRQPH